MGRNITTKGREGRGLGRLSETGVNVRKGRERHNEKHVESVGLYGSGMREPEREARPGLRRKRRIT